MLFVVSMYRNKVIVFLFGFALGFLFILNNNQPIRYPRSLFMYIFST